MFLQLNNDGSYTQGSSSGGGRIRNSLENLMFAYFINRDLVHQHHENENYSLWP